LEFQDTLIMNTPKSNCIKALTLLAIGLLPLTAGSQGATVARPAARTLSKPASPTRPVDAAGFIRRWLVLEPIKVAGVVTESGFQEALQGGSIPALGAVLPRHGDAVTVNDSSLTWHAVDTALYNVNLYHFAWALNKPTSNVLFWAITVIDAPKEMTGVRLAIGSNAASNWWLNDERVIGIYNDRQAVIDDGVSKRITLRKGRNVIRAAILNAGGATDFCARFLDANDKPITGLAVSLPSS
jgi:hypothetical protein